MSVQMSSSGLVVDERTPVGVGLGFIDSVLRGVGQVMLQNNSYAGLLFLIGVFYNSPLFGVAVLVGAVASTTTARLLAVDRSQVQAGLFGFNGALVGVAVLYFLHPGALTWVCLVFAAACSTVLMAAMLHLMSVWKAPVLTAPFVFVSLCVFLATARFGRLASTELLPTAGLPHSVSVEGVVTGSTVVEGLFSGVAQVFFQASPVTGVLFLIGLLVASRTAAVAALVGSLLGLMVAWGLGAAEPAIRSGAFGFNSALTMIALVSVFFRPGVASVIYAALAAVASTVVFAAVSASFAPIGMPALTLPFVLVVWVFVLAGPAFQRLRRADA
ncbi:MAG: urea transporter [Brevundimonas sp.]